MTTIGIGEPEFKKIDEAAQKESGQSAPEPLKKSPTKKKTGAKPSTP
jgi:hypothetical protein